MAFIGHKGKPCTPPIVDGVTFAHVKGPLWAAEVSDEQAERFARIETYSILKKDPFAPAGVKGKGKADDAGEPDAIPVDAPQPPEPAAV